MKPEEAIEYIKKNCYGEWCEDDWREAMDMSIKALKKRIPQIVSPTTPIKRCRNCGRELSTVNASRPMRYYCVCGQIIDWKDEP